MFLQASLLLSAVVCVVTCLLQPLDNCAILPGVPGFKKINMLPKVDTKVLNANQGTPKKTGLKDVQGILGGNKLPIINVRDSLLPKGDLGVMGNKTSLTNVSLPVLKLEGSRWLEKKIMATSGKEVDFETSFSTCKAVGGHIATPINEAEDNAILAFVKIAMHTWESKQGQCLTPFII